MLVFIFQQPAKEAPSICTAFLAQAIQNKESTVDSQISGTVLGFKKFVPHGAKSCLSKSNV